LPFRARLVAAAAALCFRQAHGALPDEIQVCTTT